VGWAFHPGYARHHPPRRGARGSPRLRWFPEGSCPDLWLTLRGLRSKGSGLDYNARAPLLDQLAAARGSKVISYITGDRRQLETQVSPEIIDIFVEHLDAIGPTSKISLVLHTNGGDTSAAWRLINLLHTFCDELEVIIPSKAMSAGTLISLGADRIVMTKQAALGPIDPSISHPLNPLVPNAPNVRAPVSVEAVRGYLDAAAELGIKGEAQLAQLLVHLSDKVHPLVLGQIFRSRSQIRFLAGKLIKRQVNDNDKAKQIIDFLCAESGSHDYTINRREASELGLRVEKPDAALYELIRALHQSVVQELKLLDPFDPFSLLAGAASVHYTLPRAIIESRAAGCHQFLSEGTFTGTQVPVPGPPGAVAPGINDNRRFDGWRKVA
jgi:hypothetical protein